MVCLAHKITDRSGGAETTMRSASLTRSCHTCGFIDQAHHLLAEQIDDRRQRQLCSVWCQPQNPDRGGPMLCPQRTSRTASSLNFACTSPSSYS